MTQIFGCVKAANSVRRVSYAMQWNIGTSASTRLCMTRRWCRDCERARRDATRLRESMRQQARLRIPRGGKLNACPFYRRTDLRAACHAYRHSPDPVQARWVDPRLRLRARAAAISALLVEIVPARVTSAATSATSRLSSSTQTAGTIRQQTRFLRVPIPRAADSISADLLRTSQREDAFSCIGRALTTRPYTLRECLLRPLHSIWRYSQHRNVHLLSPHLSRVARNPRIFHAAKPSARSVPPSRQVSPFRGSQTSTQPSPSFFPRAVACSRLYGDS
ncbi:hypothetical protein EXIGLDRAFT_358837 [Exidia glandulosa HHB12029]|uniref:Uncharacterized protein n=1 Tax=Exidia glandulosa HHB12029 TaxID=1314781 RepID=A0A165C801_EXIGL|nr:hypothetical protein EXIGLDRAFT_358837 [Exidia glandulosa HHB12029]